MSDTIQQTAQASVPAQWNLDLLFSALSDSVRRKLLLTLVEKGALPATHLNLVVGRKLDATLKHLTAMRSAGLVVMAPDSKDRRRQLYKISPAISVTKLEKGVEFNFGFCRLSL